MEEGGRSLGALGGAGGDGAQAREGVEGSPGAEVGGDLARVLTLPNAISLARLLAVGLFAYLTLETSHRLAATVVLVVLGATDWVDGYTARHLHQVSTVGKVLDPVADRVLLGTAVAVELVVGAVPAWVAAAVLARELAVSLGVLGLAALGARRIDVRFIGKAGTFVLMTAFPCWLLGSVGGTWHPAREVALGLSVVGIVLAWAALANYVGPARSALRARRVGGES